MRFTKGHGTGNDFVLVADPDGALALTEVQIAALCDRHFGIGADGLLRAVRVAADPEASALGDAEWFMDYRNADGTTAEMCGNGIRVFVHFLIAEGLIDLPVGATVRVLTRGGLQSVRRLSDGDFEVDLGRWREEGGDPLVTIAGVPVARPGLAITVPNPHVVVAVADDAELDAADLTRAPHLDPEPAAGANVELVRPGEPLVEHGVGRIRMRVHERGSGETLSCGTGAVAAALATRIWAGSRAPDDWRVQVPGGELRVRMFPAADGEHVALTGPARLVYTGEVALAEPALVTSSTR